jgi:hypothetical protein
MVWGWWQLEVSYGSIIFCWQFLQEAMIFPIIGADFLEQI